MRHTQLRYVGAPTIAKDLVGEIRLMTGTLWHRWWGEALVKQGIPFMQEVNLTPYMPTGWSGTADWVFWSDRHQAFVLGDLKTQKGEGMQFIESGGPKLEHAWQLSAYWYALEEMGLPLVRGYAIMYQPMNADLKALTAVEPIVVEADPLPKALVIGRMNERWEKVQDYASLSATEGWICSALAPVQPRVQKVYWNGPRKAFELKLVPHWSTQYCPFPNELCDCSEQGTTKVGEWVAVKDSDYLEYRARKGYEDEEPVVGPTKRDIARRRKELYAD